MEKSLAHQMLKEVRQLQQVDPDLTFEQGFSLVKEQYHNYVATSKIEQLAIAAREMLAIIKRQASNQPKKDFANAQA